MLTDKFYNDIAKIRKDSIHGAVYITLELLKAIKNEAKRTKLNSIELDLIIKELVTVHPEMASIKSIINSLEECKSSKLCNGDFYTELIDTMTERIKIKEKITSNNIMKEIQKHKSFMTLSYSTTILEACKLMPKNSRNKIAYVLESRSKREGIILAKRLAELGYDVRIIVDAAAAYFASEIEIFVIGADTIFPDGSILNKIGSLQLALVANYYKKPFYVAASTNKISHKKIDEYTELISEKPTDDIYKSDIKNLKARNIYFEIVPAKLITKIISDEDWHFFIKK